MTRPRDGSEHRSRPLIALARNAAFAAAAIGFLTLSLGRPDEAEVSAARGEGELLKQIRDAASADARRLLITALENTPVREFAFYERWLFIHEIDRCLVCWSAEGYDATRSPVPRDVQILSATCYGAWDIDNGGFRHFFAGGTGRFAPEMVEWLERAGLIDTAGVVREAMKVFGPEFPRSEGVRREFLAKSPTTGNDRLGRDPFHVLDERFDDVFSRRSRFDPAADAWLRKTCGIASLAESY